MIKIKIHSFVDVITNSSTTIYCQCTDKTILAAKELINFFLKESGSKKTADDLFEFKLVLSERAIENLAGMIDEGDLDDYLKENKYRKGNSTKLAEKILTDIEKGKVYEPDVDYKTNGDGMNEEELLIIPKSDKANVINLANKINDIFEIDAYHD
ncbi:MAG: hypothetical protein WC346_06760 [Methanogenium sp.]|jgi:hypothetical protein